MPNGLFTLKQVNAAVQQGAWPNQKTPAVDYLVVAGGGGGGYISAAGAGGLLQGNIPVAAGSAITVTVGAGGTGRTTGGGVSTNGSNSVFSSITSIGGGAGVYNNDGSGASGGSGASNGVNAFGAVGQGTAGQGNAGGLSLNSGGSYYGGGGGGAGTTGIAAYNGACGAGGSGIASAISGTITAYAGGGGGSHAYGANPGAGGVGGGGAGGGAANGTSGTANTGGGGGSSSYTGSYWNGGNGGSGIVILSYPDVYAAATSTTGSPTVSTSGSGSLLTTGTTYLRYAAQTPFAFGTGDFTIEMWVYRPAGAVLGILFDFRPSSTNGAYPYLFKDTDNKLYYYVNSASRITSSTVLTADAWSHIAICRSGTVTTMYQNGASVGTYTDTTNYLVGTSAPTLFADNSGLYSFTGNTSNVRVVKGVSVYTGAFTPPTGPLQATQSAGTNISAITGTQTSLLLNTVSGAYVADSSTNSYSPANTIAVTPPWNASSPFTGTGYKNRVYKWTSSGSITF